MNPEDPAATKPASILAVVDETKHPPTALRRASALPTRSRARVETASLFRQPLAAYS